MDLIEHFFTSGKILKEQRKAAIELIEDYCLTSKSRDIFISKLFLLFEQNLAHGKSLNESASVLESLVKMVIHHKSAPTIMAVNFSPGIACKRNILSHIQRAKFKLDVAVFTISDNDIRDELINAKNRGVQVRIITDNDKAMDEGSDIRFLSDNNIDIKIDQTSNHMHHKFSICDEKIVLTGSYNWTLSAAKFNQENTIEISDTETVNAFQEEFNQLWQKLTHY